MLRANAREWAELLGGSTDALRQRPRADRWSPLEYACHVRDVFGIYDQRLDLMLTEDGPRYPNWNQDETARAERYNDADPAVVAVEVVEAADALAVRFDSVTGEGWRRTGHRSDGASFTVDTFPRYFIHDPVHHLWDVRQ